MISVGIPCSKWAQGYEVVDDGKTEGVYNNVNIDNTKDSASDVEESKDTYSREKTQEYSYKDFNLFDQRTKEDKKIKQRVTEYVYQNQLFFIKTNVPRSKMSVTIPGGSTAW